MDLIEVIRFVAGALAGHRLRSFLSALGVGIGVAEQALRSAEVSGRAQRLSWSIAASALLLGLLILAFASAISRDNNGFDLSDSLVPADQIHLGGPARDGIPAIDHPRFVAATEAGFLNDQERVLGLAHNGVIKAYPIAIMNWHEVVNDRFAAEPVAITYCPLCGTGVAFAAHHAHQE